MTVAGFGSLSAGAGVLPLQAVNAAARTTQQTRHGHFLTE
jgi:hypothetical protein